MSTQFKIDLVLIRHAESEYNLEQRKACNSSTEVKNGENLQTKFKKDLIDCSLTEEGKNQCLQAEQICENLNIGIVLVSPLRRALETCKEIFKNHKNKPKVIVNPLFREMLLSNCDIGGRILESKEDFPEYDFSFLEQYENPILWNVYELTNKQKVQEIEANIKNICVQESIQIKKHGHFKLLEIIKQMFPVHIESQQEYNQNVQLQKQYILNLLEKMPQGTKIAIVGHSRALESFTAASYENETLIGAHWFKNAEVYQMQLDVNQQM
ncbi:phosphoglycerate mutase, putative [Ichthyophthirius multifiliis]|uniref:Phosphoglycerate mutase, putative n=1 Tax=Ichthyophthirius multifiliis TaxID=5932 RepID=G0R080_ICHMU|nr:phosphoglycerate mutase, putative [Ichthyophthirius multifiliis]EGR29140.1 phosphoglycerate mutase, putative [Ichthyophthirius multifiliis]|eukprot:XP_004030376.1 phosphoglycerate mutase, putative [Ichthyophthirius multifiliis]